MKRLLLLVLILALCGSVACAKTQTSEPESAPKIAAPAETEVQLRLPLGARDDIAKSLPAYTAGFAAESGEPLTFAVASGDPVVAEGVLREDGTLYVIAHGTGETKLTVTAKTASGEHAASVVSVKITDARRMLALIVLGVLAVALLILLGRPVKKAPEAKNEAPVEAPETPTVLFADEEPKEEPNENPERS